MKKPIISFIIPSYNSSEFMNRAIDPLLKVKGDIEVLIIDDGSKDTTLEVAKKYEENNPDRVKAIHQENKGHGGACNTGIENSKGEYIKVIDSDDWINPEDIDKLINTIKEHRKNKQIVDLYVANYVYEHVADNTRKVVNYTKGMEDGKIITWNELGKFGLETYFMMHSLFYRKQVIIDSGLKLLEHHFYVDNIYVYQPLPFVKTLCYLNIDMYHYFIGRADQSMNMDNLFNRYTQQNDVTKEILSEYSYSEIMKMDKGLKNYLLHEGTLMLVASCVFTTSGKKDVKARKIEWSNLVYELKKKDKKLYSYWAWHGFVWLTNLLPWSFRRFVTKTGYKISQKRMKIG